MTFTLVPERPDDAALNTPLLDRTFGFDRTKRTVYRLRAGIEPVAELCFSAVAEDGGLLGSIRYWPIRIDETPAILLGPLAVEPAQQGRGIGRALVAHSLEAAGDRGHGICVVVGDPVYYGAFGFSSAAAAGLSLPGPVEPERFQVKALLAGALEEVYGVIARAGKARTSSRRRLRRSVA
ncbi:GNAT family N-acetyltransferase [Pelagibius sp.]|uniref:GNAT family N-acetyltransferase n=1 Tax=Pelagibius sp. TaxID=1931238 RepID=UPI003B51099F